MYIITCLLSNVTDCSLKTVVLVGVSCFLYKHVLLSYHYLPPPLLHLPIHHHYLFLHV